MAEPAGDVLFLDLRAGGAIGLEKLFPAPGYFVAYIDGASIQDKAALMAALAAAFRFPAYFGRNWDALLDCLRSLPDEIPAKGYVLAIKSSKTFLAGSPADLEAFSYIAAEAKKFLGDRIKAEFKIAML